MIFRIVHSLYFTQHSLCEDSAFGEEVLEDLGGYEHCMEIEFDFDSGEAASLALFTTTDDKLRGLFPELMDCVLSSEELVDFLDEK